MVGSVTNPVIISNLLIALFHSLSIVKLAMTEVRANFICPAISWFDGHQGILAFNSTFNSNEFHFQELMNGTFSPLDFL